MKRAISMLLVLMIIVCAPALAEEGGFPFADEVELMIAMHNILFEGLPEEAGDASGMMLVPVDVTEMASLYSFFNENTGLMYGFIAGETGIASIGIYFTDAIEPEVAYLSAAAFLSVHIPNQTASIFQSFKEAGNELDAGEDIAMRSLELAEGITADLMRLRADSNMYVITLNFAEPITVNGLLEMTQAMMNS